VPAREVLRHFIGRLPTYAGALMLSRLVLALSAVAVITLPVAAAHLALIHEAVLLENATVGQSHRRASRIARHRASRAALVPAATVGVTGASIVVCELLGQALVQSVLQFGEPFGTLWDSGGSLYALAGYFVSIPLVATARFLFYIDGRTLRDGWDIQIRFMRIQVEAEGRAA
jgi:hypothetical protein